MKAIKPMHRPLLSILLLLPGVALRAQEDRFSLADLRRWSSEVEEQISAIRGQPFERAVEVGWMAPKDFTKYAIDQFEKTSSRAEIALQAIVLSRLGLLPAKVDYLQTYLNLIEDQAGGFYDPHSSTFYVIEGFESTEPIVRLLMAHELTHALDDQLHDLEGMIAKVVGDDDRTFALQCLLEGSATHVMTVWMLQAMKSKQISMKELMEFQRKEQKRFKAFEQSPIFLQWSLLGPYLAGNLFLKRGRARSAEVSKEDYSRVFGAPPVSSEQILHPEKYWDPKQLDRPSRIRLEIPAGWESRYQNSLGEFGIAVLFKGEKASFNTLRMATMSLSLKSWTHVGASGWDGDRYYLLAKGAEQVVAWVSIWDDPEEAAQFAAVLADAFSKASVSGAHIEQRDEIVLVVQAQRGAAKLAGEWLERVSAEKIK